MSDTNSRWSPLARFVLFMICLSIIGSLVAGISAYAAGQHRPLPPSNVCSYQMDADCRVYVCDDVCSSPAQYRPPSAACDACVDECKRTQYPDCYGSI
jgi:hypothetical protein